MAVDLHRYSGLSSFEVGGIFGAICFGVIFRRLGDVSGAVLRASRSAAVDNNLQAAGEALWVLLLIIPQSTPALTVANAYAGSGAVACFIRWIAATTIVHRILPVLGLIDRHSMVQLLMPDAAQMQVLADLMYLPATFVIMNWYLPVRALAEYASVVGIDLFLQFVASVLAAHWLQSLPADPSAARPVVGLVTQKLLITLSLLSLGVWIFAPAIFQVWLGEHAPLACAVLPLALVHAILSGAGAAERFMLIRHGATGRIVKGTMVAGITNIGLTPLLLGGFNMGLIAVACVAILAYTAGYIARRPWLLGEMRDIQPRAV
jgi:hypothetical protein